MEEENDKQKKSYLPFPSLAGPLNKILGPLKISSKGDIQHGIWRETGETN
jgi:hypothetical protein